MKLFFLLVLAALGWFGYQRYMKDAFILTDNREENIVKLRAYAASVNAKGPKEEDAETTLLGMDVTTRGIVSRYKTTASNAAATYNGEPESSGRSGLRKDACDDRRFRMAMEHGFSIGYKYFDALNNELGTYTFRITDCSRN